MRIAAVMIMAFTLAMVWGVRIHPENFSQGPNTWVTLRDEDNLLIRSGLLPPRSKTRIPGSVGSVWGAKPQTTAVSAPSQPTAQETSKKASELARKATYASQF